MGVKTCYAAEIAMSTANLTELGGVSFLKALAAGVP